MTEEQNSQEQAQVRGPGEERRSIFSYLNPFYGMVWLSEVLLFTKYFATLTKAGIPVLRSLATLSRQMKTWSFKSLIWQMKEEVEGGMPLYSAFRKNEDIFSLLYINLIRVGEESGRLFLVLDRLSTLLERKIKLKRKVVSALTYPLIITIVAAAVVFFLMYWIIPQFARLFEQFGQELPMPTQIVITTSNFLVDNVLTVGAIVFGIFLLFYQVNRTRAGKYFFDALKLKIPVFGGLFQKYEVAMFSRNLATLFQSGVPIISGMKITIEAIENFIISDSLLEVVKDVEGGIPIARALEKVEIMPELSTQMIEVGEESGNLDEMLEKVADFYEEEINFLIDQITALIEPAFIVVLGTIVGFIVIAMYLPIFRMARVVTGGGESGS